MKKPQYCLFELRQRGCRGNDAAAEPERDAQTETPAIGDRDKFLDLIDEPLAASAVAVQRVMNFLDVAPN
jgi:hypothetical protein